MHVLALAAVALQISSLYPGARAQDSVNARDALLRGLVELEQVTEFTDRTLPSRYIRQLTTWGADDRAWSLAARFDTIAITPASRDYPHTRSLALGLFWKNDTLTLDRRLDAYSQQVRDRILTNVSSGASCASPNMAWFVPRVQGLYQRAIVIEQSGRLCATGDDTIRRRETLRTAANLMLLDTSVFAPSNALRWLVELRRIGGEVTIADLVRAATQQDSSWWRARYAVAQSLIEAGDRPAALPLLDSAVASLADIPAEAGARAAVHYLRGTRADSAIAKAIRDSIDATRPPPRRPSSPSRGAQRIASGIVAAALSGQDTLRVRNTLAHALRLDDTVSVLIAATSRLQAQLLRYPRHPDPSERDSRVTMARFLFIETMRLSEQLVPIPRDSVRAAAIALLAIVNVDSALHSLRHVLYEPRLRERALAHTLVNYARTDADRAEALAASLRDPIARDLLYPELVERALASGRLNAAIALAERTVGNQARVRTHLAIAAAEVHARRSTSARARLTAILPEIDPLWQCQQSCDPPFAIPPELERDQKIIGKFALTAIDLGMQDDLNGWARTRGDPERRAAAWLTIAEAIAQQRFGVSPNYRALY